MAWGSERAYQEIKGSLWALQVLGIVLFIDFGCAGSLLQASL